MTPDSDFILDVHPTWRNIVIGAGFSGSLISLFDSIKLDV